MKVAVVGATGLVGTVMMEALEERNFPVSTLYAVASEKSVGKEVLFKGEKHKVIGMQTAVDLKPDIAIFSAGGGTSKEWAPKFAEAGTVVIDNSPLNRSQKREWALPSTPAHSPAAAMAAPTMPASLRSRAGMTWAVTVRRGIKFSCFLHTPPPRMIKLGENNFSMWRRYSSSRPAHSFHFNFSSMRIRSEV